MIRNQWVMVNCKTTTAKYKRIRPDHYTIMVYDQLFGTWVTTHPDYYAEDVKDLVSLLRKAY